MAAKLREVKGEVVLRILGEEIVVGTLDIPVSLSGPDENGHAIVKFPKATVRAELKKLGTRIARSLA